MKYRTIETQIPWKYKWKAIDKDGKITVFVTKPKCNISNGFWESYPYYFSLGYGPEPKDWTKTLVKL